VLTLLRCTSWQSNSIVSIAEQQHCESLLLLLHCTALHCKRNYSDLTQI
jgi:hypothetical protein